LLEQSARRLDFVSRPTQLTACLKKRPFDILIINTAGYDTARHEYFEIIRQVIIKSPATRIIVLAHTGRVLKEMADLESSVVHTLAPGVGDKRLVAVFRAAARTSPEYAPNLLLEKGETRHRMGTMIGRSPSMRKVFKQIRQAAQSDIPVLLLGETGTGKDLAAQNIHRLSKRREDPFLPLNLGSLPSELIASELFGHEKGAFSGATARHQGVFERATGGTVFLDEIDAVSEKVRVSLLRVIEQKKFSRLGGGTSLRSKARIITASNADLEGLVKRGDFRKDLFYRLDVFRISLPPLRDRRDDIPAMINQMVADFNRAQNKKILRIAPDLIDALTSYDWPGNVRELKNVIQRAVLVCDGEDLLPGHLPHRFLEGYDDNETVTFKVGTTLEEVEREMVIQALKVAGNNRTRAAELLGISRRVIYNKLEKYDLK
jgi:DNA-binding NtrC family response regulator